MKKFAIELLESYSRLHEAPIGGGSVAAGISVEQFIQQLENEVQGNSLITYQLLLTENLLMYIEMEVAS